MPRQQVLANSTSDDFHAQLYSMAQIILNSLTGISNKTEVTHSAISFTNRVINLLQMFEKMKNNPLSIMDAMLVVAENNQLIVTEAMKITNYTTFDNWVQM